MLTGYGNFIFAHRNQVFPVVLLLLLAGLRPELPFADTRWDDWLDGIGIVLACAGQGLRALVIGLAYIKRGGLNRKVYADRFVTEGVFRHCRNPLYLGNLLILAGLFLVHGNPLVFAAGMAFFLFTYNAMVAAEERYLGNKFGSDYRTYCATVSRWWPDWRGLWNTVTGAEFNWRRVIAKDYASACTWVIVLLAILGYESFVYPLASDELLGFKLHRFTVLGGLVVATLLLAVAAWTAKKRIWRGRSEIA